MKSFGGLIMWRPAISVAILVALGVSTAWAAQPDQAALEQRAASLEKQIGELQRELAQVREALQTRSPRKAVTPHDAVAAFQKNPKQPVTVEFGVERIGYPDAPSRVGDDPEPAISATWDNYLPGGGTLTAIVPPQVYRKLLLPTTDGKTVALAPGKERRQVVEHIERHGLRVTGVLERDAWNGYVIRIEDAKNVELYIAGSGR
jgi:hypothetical protein